MANGQPRAGDRRGDASRTPAGDQCGLCGMPLDPALEGWCTGCGAPGADLPPAPPLARPAQRAPAARRTPPVEPPTPRARPGWALPVLVFGLVTAAVALYFDALFMVRHATAPVRYDSFVLLYNVVLGPLSAALLAAGVLALVPATGGRRWLRVVVAGAALLWAVAACYGPMLLTDAEPAL